MEQHLQILELSREASWDDVEKAYREMLKVWHPDRFGHDPDLLVRAEEKTKQIIASFEALRANWNGWQNTRQSQTAQQEADIGGARSEQPRSRIRTRRKDPYRHSGWPYRSDDESTPSRASRRLRRELLRLTLTVALGISLYLAYEVGVFRSTPDDGGTSGYRSLTAPVPSIPADPRATTSRAQTSKESHIPPGYRVIRPTGIVKD